MGCSHFREDLKTSKYMLDKYGFPTSRKFAYRAGSWSLTPAENEGSLYFNNSLLRLLG